MSSAPWIPPRKLAVMLDAPAPGLFALIREDLANHGGRWGAQGFWALAVHRFGDWRYGIVSPWLRKPMSALYKVAYKLVQIAAGIELPCEAKVGRGVVIDHFGGIIVSGYAVIGDGCRLRQGVSIGLARADDPCAPTLGRRVDIGAGAKLLGHIHIGDHAQIGANAVVTRDVPAGYLAVGVPARNRPVVSFGPAAPALTADPLAIEASRSAARGQIAARPPGPQADTGVLRINPGPGPDQRRGPRA